MNPTQQALSVMALTDALLAIAADGRASAIHSAIAGVAIVLLFASMLGTNKR